MRKTIASQNIIRRTPYYPFFISTINTQHTNPPQFYSSICLKLIRIAYPMNSLTNEQATPFSTSAHSPLEYLESDALIVLNPIPFVDSHQELTPSQNVKSHHLTLYKNASDIQSNDAPVITSQTHPSLDNNSSFMSQVQNLSIVHSTLQVDMTVEMNKYFEECATAIKEFDLYRDKFVKVSNHKIKKMIKSGEVEISDKRQDLALKQREKARMRQLETKRRQVQMEKYEIIRKLKTIEQQQIDLVHMSIKQSRNRSVQMKKVSFSAQEKEKVAQLLRAKKEFEKSLVQKTEEYIKNSHQLKKMQEQQVRKMQQAENQHKKQQIAKRLKYMELKAQQRKEILKNSVLKIKHNYIHRQLQNKYKSLQKIAQQQTQMKLKELSIKHKLNIDKINEHDRQYRERLQKRFQSLSQIKPNTHVQTKRYQPNYFGKVIDEELFEIKQRNFQKQMKIKENEYKSKILKYQQKIDKEHKPKVDPSKAITVVPRTYSSLTLTKEQRTEKGLEYLAKAKQMKRSVSSIQEAPKQQQNYGYKAYKDYLRERQSSNIDATEKELKQIISKKENNDYNSLLRAKFLAQGLQAKSKKSSDDKLYFSVKTKLSLLSQFY